MSETMKHEDLLKGGVIPSIDVSLGDSSQWL